MPGSNWLSANRRRDFCYRIAADQYVFSRNGQHEKSDLDVLGLVFDRRMSGDNRGFTFCFTSTSSLSIDPAGQEPMRAVERLVKKFHQKTPRWRTKFISGSALRIL